MRIPLMVVLTLTVCGCPRLSPEARVKRQYDRCHAEWIAYWNRPDIRIRSDLRGFDEFPVYKAIVALGPPGVPYIAQSVRDNEVEADLLAYAIIDIKRWNRDDFSGLGVGGTSAEEMRRKVLAKVGVEP